jgi:hypothetical protein
VQKYVQTVQQQQAQSGKNKETLAKEKEKEAREQAKRNAEAKKRMEAELFRPAQVQKVPFGTGEWGEAEQLDLHNWILSSLGSDSADFCRSKNCEATCARRERRRWIRD